MSLIRPRAQARDLASVAGGDTLSFANMAALRLYMGPTTTAEVVARTAYGDEGGGTFAIDPTDGATVDDGAMTIVDALGRRWKRLGFEGILYPEWFGAVRDGVADDKPAWAAAVAYGVNLGSARVRGMAGTYRFASKLLITTGNIHLEGAAGKNSTIIEGDFNGDDIISIGDGTAAPNFCSVTDLRIDGGTTPRTSGAAVRLRNGHDILVDNIHFGLNHATCVQLDGGPQQFIYKVSNCEMSAGAIGIDVGSAGGVVQDPHIEGNTIFSMTTAGLRFVHSSGGFIGGNSVAACFRGFVAIPGDGQYVTGAKFEQNYSDTCQSDGWFFTTSHANGSVTDIDIVDCWAASCGTADNHHGVWIAPNTGTLSGLNFIGLRSSNNLGSGAVLDGGTEVEFNNCQMFCNSQAGSGLGHGLAINAGVSRFKVIGGWYGKGGRIGYVTGTNNQAYGVIVNAGASDNYIISGVTALDNVVAGISDGGTGATKVVEGNIGIAEGRSAVADAAYTVRSTDRIVAYTSLSAARTVALPAASSYPVGKRLVIIDESGSASASNTISLDPNGSDTLDGSSTTQVLINVPRGRCELESNGSNGWGLLACSVEYTNSIPSDVAMNDSAVYHTGPSVAQGAVGRWEATGNVNFKDTTGGGIYFIKLWDGTTAVDSSVVYGIATDYVMHAAQSGTLSSPAGNIRVSVRDISSNSGVIVANATGVTKDSTITVRRIP